MRDIVVDCDVVSHSENASAGDNHRHAVEFLTELVAAPTRICLDDRGFIFHEYESLGLLTSPNPIIKSFFLELSTPGRVWLIDESTVDPEIRQFIGQLPIDQHDKPHLRTAACTLERWLVSHDGTYMPQR